MAPDGMDDNGKSDNYTGRTGVYEILVMSLALRQMIAELRPASEIARKSIEEGMIDFRRAALLKVAQGITSFDEMQRVVPTGSMWVNE